jgi:hypothetical protein
MPNLAAGHHDHPKTLLKKCLPKWRRDYFSNSYVCRPPHVMRVVLIAAPLPGSQYRMGYRRLHPSPPCQIFPTPSTTSLSKFYRESLLALPSHVNRTRIPSSNWSPNGSLSHTCAVSGVPSLSTTTFFGEPSPLTYRQSGSGLS